MVDTCSVVEDISVIEQPYQAVLPVSRNDVTAQQWDVTWLFLEYDDDLNRYQTASGGKAGVFMRRIEKILDYRAVLWESNSCCRGVHIGVAHL